MDLQTAQRLSGKRWQIAKLAALLFFAMACALLVSSLAASSRNSEGVRSIGLMATFTTER